ncbi:hypothetical protein D3C75_1209790 [compost metagenome]
MAVIDQDGMQKGRGNVAFLQPLSGADDIHIVRIQHQRHNFHIRIKGHRQVIDNLIHVGQIAVNLVHDLAVGLFLHVQHPGLRAVVKHSG